MSGLESELRAAFAEATAALVPSPGLTGRVRHSVRRRRASVAAGSALVAAIVGLTFALVPTPGKDARPSLPTFTGPPTLTGPPSPTKSPHPTGSTPPASSEARPQLRIDGPGGPIAVTDSTVYVAISLADGERLTAYDRSTGHLRFSVTVPAPQRSLAVGADGTVWLTFYPSQTGTASGVWRLSPDLKQRSALSLDTPDRNWAAFAVLPTTGNQALLATDFGLATVSLPPPGQPGLASGSLKTPAVVPRGATPTDLAAFGHDVAVFEHPDVSTLNPRIVIDGKPRLSYDVGPAGQINSMSAGSAGLWLTTNSTVDQRAQLVLLDDGLRPIAPGPIVEDPDLGEPQTVMASGRTVWLTTSGGRDRFVCFASDNKSEAKATIAANPDGTLLAVTPDEVFVSEKRGISGYPVPKLCR